jgi:transcription elongation GreA/GreB family factor
MIADLALDAQNDAKGSAGDKHETALSMMQLEQEKLSNKVKEYLELKSTFDSIAFDKKSAKIGIGSLVKLNDFYVLLCISLPKTEIDGSSVWAISLQAPLAQNLLNKQKSDQFSFNATHYEVISVE